MHFMASPAAYLTAAYERILFTKHSFKGPALYLLQSHSRHECRTSTGALEDAKHCAASALCRCGATYSQHAAFETHANIGGGAGKKRFGESNDGPIPGGHHCGDAADGGHGVFGGVVDVRWRSDGQQLQYAAHVGARKFLGAHAAAAFYCGTGALTANGAPLMIRVCG